MDSAEKQGPLWDVYRMLAAEDALGKGTGKAKMDGRSFVSSFMVTVAAQNVHPTLGMADVTEEEKVLRQMTEETLKPKYNVEMCINLGKAQFAPVGINKRTALEHVAAKLGVSLAAAPAPAQGPKKVACALFDDENDLGFASACSLGYAPSVAHPSVIPALEQLGPRFQRAPIQGLLGTEFALTQLLEMATRNAAIV
jgi:hydroxymethylpyrimidine pyrophosphatase-like HAD family hydrolase